MKDSDEEKEPPKMRFLTGPEIEELKALAPRFRTGLPEFDSHIDGGILAGSFVEIYGPQWAGKTLMCTQIGVINHSLGDIFWYDSEGTFRENTVREIAFRMGLDPESVLRKFHVVRSLGEMSVEDLTGDLWRRSNKEGSCFIVLDSLTETKSVLRGSPDMYDILRVLAKIRVKTDTTLIFTSRTSVPVSRITEQDRESRSSRSVSDMTSFRMMIEPKGEHERRLVFEDSISIPNGEWKVSLGHGGLYPDEKARKLQERRVKRYLRRLRAGRDPTRSSP